MKRKICWSCQGFKKEERVYTFGPEYVDCTYCFGEGWIEDRVYEYEQEVGDIIMKITVTCPSCNGKGTVIVHDNGPWGNKKYDDNCWTCQGQREIVYYMKNIPFDKIEAALRHFDEINDPEWSAIKFRKFIGKD